MEIETLIEILEASAKKNGKDTYITIGHLLAILKMAVRNANRDDYDNYHDFSGGWGAID